MERQPLPVLVVLMVKGETEAWQLISSLSNI